MVDNDFEAIWFKELELSVGDEAAYLKDLVGVGIETGHLYISIIDR
jgi:hypothetical protein